MSLVEPLTETAPKPTVSTGEGTGGELKSTLGDELASGTLRDGLTGGGGTPPETPAPTGDGDGSTASTRSRMGPRVHSTPWWTGHARARVIRPACTVARSSVTPPLATA